MKIEKNADIKGKSAVQYGGKKSVMKMWPGEFLPFMNRTGLKINKWKKMKFPVNDLYLYIVTFKNIGKMDLILSHQEDF